MLTDAHSCATMDGVTSKKLIESVRQQQSNSRDPTFWSGRGVRRGSAGFDIPSTERRFDSWFSLLLHRGGSEHVVHGQMAWCAFGGSCRSRSGLLFHSSAVFFRSGSAVVAGIH